LKFVISTILIISILSFQFSELVVYVSFKLNQDYIAKNLCVEKDIEDSTCKGCCQLKSKMEEQQEQKETLPPIQNNKQNIDFCSQFSSCQLFIPALLQTLQKKPKLLYSLKLSYSIFHPPKSF